MTKIYIDAGHGGNDPGASGNGLREKVLTLTIAKKVRDLLKGRATVRMSRTNDKTLSLSQRTNDANNWGADYFLSIHINAGGGTGYEDFIYNGNVSNKTKTIRDTIHAEIIKQIPDVNNRGKKTANFAVVRQSLMPSMLTENLFIDTKADAVLLKSNAFLNKVAKGHANGIIKAFGLGKTSAPSKPSKPKASKPKSSSNLGLVDYLKSKKINSSYSNRKKLARKHGISNYKGTASQNNSLLAKIKGSGKTSTSKPNANLKVDGYWGKATTRALQRYFKTPVDGVISKPSVVIKALQRLLGVKADGYTGPVTYRAMQRRFKTPVDGKVSKPSVMVKELQRRLNRGKL